MTHVLSHAVVLALIAGVVYGSGSAVEKHLPSPGLRSLARWLYGLAWWSLGLFSLASGGLYSVPGLALWATVTLIVVWMPSRGRSRFTPRVRAPFPGDLLVGALFGVLTLPLFLMALGPIRSWDAEVYHLSLPKLFIQSGGFRFVEISLYSHWPLGTELFFGVALMVQDFMTAKAVHFGFGLLVLYALVRGVGGRSSAAAGVAAILFLANEVVLFEMRVAYVDLAVAFYCLAAFLFVSRAVASDDRRRMELYLLPAGVAAGLLAGTKITGFVLALLVASVGLPRLLRELPVYGLRLALKPWIRSFGLPFAVGWFPWPAKSAVLTGNPFYPAFGSVFGAPDWSPEVGAKFSAWQQGIGMGREPLDYLLLLPRVILFGDRGYERFDGSIHSLWIVLLPLVAAFLFLRKRKLSRGRAALGVAGLIFLFWALSSQQMRFLIPALALVCLAIGDALAELLSRSKGLAPRLLIVATAGAALWLGTSYGELVDTGVKHWRIFNSGTFDPAQAEQPVVREVNALLDDAKVLLLQTNHRFAYDRDVLADSFFEASQIADWLKGSESAGDACARLRERAVTHILVERRPPRVFYPKGLIQLIQDPQRVEPAYDDPRHVLFRLRPGC